ncbi:MAG: hypothetical protein KJ792_01950 [Actinobacteria bacterium]|nr:hypothetical protein [Actinomycetota bacterium]MCG2801712.1 hypothetical protein [Cellulomonas sp.]
MIARLLDPPASALDAVAASMPDPTLGRVVLVVLLVTVFALLGVLAFGGAR